MGDKLQNIKQRYNLSGYKVADLEYTECNGRSYVEYNGKSSAVIKSSRRPDLRKHLKSTPLRNYSKLREDVWYRNVEISDVAINQFKNTRRNSDQPINNTWCVTYIDKLTRKRYIYAYIDNKLQMNILNFEA